MVVARGRDGFSLVEALVAMVLVSIVVLALAPVMFTAASRQAVDAGVPPMPALTK